MGNLAAPRLSKRAEARVITAIDRWLADPSTIEAALGRNRSGFDQTILNLIDGALAASNSYRDGVLIQLAWGLEQSGFDHTQKGEGARSAAGSIAKALVARHIPAVKDAYQNIGKNTANLARGNVPAFDGLLRWMNGADETVRLAALDLVAATVAATARPVLPMPELARLNLTFANVVAALDELLGIPSGGAHEQFAVAAFLEAVIDEFGLGGVGALGVRTKNINASDASAGTAADVQVLRGNKVEEAFEVSASGWRDKLDQAILAAKNADLNRVHILSYVENLEGFRELLGDNTPDVTVIDVKTFVRTLVAVLKKPAREVGLVRLYEHLDRKQPDTSRVNAYVELLGRHSLTA
jgi:hypothetical protein